MNTKIDKSPAAATTASSEPQWGRGGVVLIIVGYPKLNSSMSSIDMRGYRLVRFGFKLSTQLLSSLVSLNGEYTGRNLDEKKEEPTRMRGTTSLVCSVPQLIPAGLMKRSLIP